MNREAPILLAEDDENDAFLFTRALEKADVSRPLIVAQDGQEAIEYLEAGSLDVMGKHAWPALLLLDLKMPRMNGFDVLAWLGGRPNLKKLPVVVLTSSSLESDVIKARQLGADEYRVKPQKAEELLQIVEELKNRWLGEKHIPASEVRKCRTHI